MADDRPPFLPVIKSISAGACSVCCWMWLRWIYQNTKCLYCSLLFSAFACALSASVKFNKINVHLKIKFKIQNKSKTRTKKKNLQEKMCVIVIVSYNTKIYQPKFTNFGRKHRKWKMTGKIKKCGKIHCLYSVESTPSHTHINTFQIHFSTRSGFSWSLRIDYCTMSNRKSEAALAFFSSVGVDRNRFGNCAL